MEKNSDEEVHSEPTGLRDWKTLFIWFSAWTILFWGFSGIAPLLPVIPKALAMFFSAGLLILLAMGVVSGYSRLEFHRNGYLIMGLIGLLLVSQLAKPFVQKANTVHKTANTTGETLFLLIESSLPQFSHANEIIAVRNKLYESVSTQVEEIFPISSGYIFLLGLAQLLLASGIGLWIGSGIDKPSHLLPLGLVAGFADIWSVSAGATSLIIQSSTIYYFLLRFPLISGGEQEFPLLIGLTDFLFYGIFFRATVRFQLGTAKNVFLLAMSFFITVIAALFFQIGLPVLPFMAVCFLAGNYRKLTLTREELLQMVGFMAGIAIVGYIVTQIIQR